jgi:Protein of unknown function (DUF4245)
VSASSEQPSRSYQRSAPALIGALLAVLALIVVVWGLSQFQRSTLPNPAPAVDYHTAFAAARKAAPFRVLAPERLPPGWRATSVNWDDLRPVLSWHLGLLTAQGQYVGVEQGTGPSSSFVRAKTPATQPVAVVRLRSQRWRVLQSPDGTEHALVSREKGATTVVTGTAPLAQLESFTSSLR